MPRAIRSLTATGIAGIVLAGSAVAPAAPALAWGRPSTSDVTTAVEARRVDRVPTPKLDWYACYDYAECATVDLPLDYDKPHGATTEVALLRVKARDQQHKIGSLFLNPGGPGGSGTGIALAAPYFLGDDLLDRFDIVGVDPRGVAASDNVKCFASVKDQTRAYAGLNVAFPWTKAEEKAFVASSRAVGRACSTTGKPLTGAASTAEVARDMDVLRRAVGDRKLTYLGFSYGTALGQYYANMFPDRLRALVVDGVLNPNAWVGRGKARDQLQETRLRSADGAYRALHEILVRCAKAGPEKCALASGDPVAAYDTVARRLRQHPVVIDDPDLGTFTVSYADFVGATLGALYGPSGWVDIVDLTSQLLVLTDPAAATPARAHARLAVARRATKARQQHGYDFPYDNGLETFLTVDCTDAYHPKDAADWPALAAAEDERAPYFGRAWAWGTAPCARRTWTVRDEDAWTGPFDRRTGAPVLVVGNYWDPATNYQAAVGSAALLPNSRLLSSDSWGHTAYGTSACVTGAVDRYLLTGTLPAKGAVCTGDDQPFVEAPEGVRATTSKSALARAGRPDRGEPKRLPPVVAPLPAVGTLTVR
ncbi:MULTISPECIES: alpha/beta hydrolase [Micromonospora]|uniref:Alpha/beta hydrolase n=1 Tax=Micromonospora solifontis TaxID=2487138 RepID=A0ABX9WGV5_9ACTN|nr:MULTISPECIES: alpha/beta hydrolase [Micromonospora]NES17115.1 alpha/beta hydrolase [Micromonospora sp. PPF5-17B]NES36729.1 alpha/beta hydrolase [Micromonospora solifontis]NES55756.1 alpha/beta hydrolase [Micromonospora sp. PPF5-6]RNL99190.1 alpha/beta hydrolase [Micromonospora solifontis]